MSKQKATIEQFNELHELVTNNLIGRLKSEDWTAADIKAATDWLYKNNITGVAVPNSPLDMLRLVVPQIDPEEVTRRVNGAA